MDHLLSRENPDFMSGKEVEFTDFGKFSFLQSNNLLVSKLLGNGVFF